eukprot:scaffold15674_cov81-Skeletonema_dohrnii-CCMP3373.AAC.2
MKLFAIAAAVLLRCIHSSEAAAPNLRANMKGASSKVEVEVAEFKKRERTTDAAEVSGCRERISQYVSGGQMFFIVANQTIVYEDPSTDPFSFTNIYWMCQPTVAPDLN